MYPLMYIARETPGRPDSAQSAFESFKGGFWGGSGPDPRRPSGPDFRPIPDGIAFGKTRPGPIFGRFPAPDSGRIPTKFSGPNRTRFPGPIFAPPGSPHPTDFLLFSPNSCRPPPARGAPGSTPFCTHFWPCFGPLSGPRNEPPSGTHFPGLSQILGVCH